MDSSENCQSCRTLLLAVLTSLLLMCGGIGLYMFHQASMMRVQLTQQQRFISDFTQNAVPKGNKFISGLQAFAKTYPDFAPILVKYNLQTAAPAVSAPAPKK